MGLLTRFKKSWADKGLQGKSTAPFEAPIKTQQQDAALQVQIAAPRVASGASAVIVRPWVTEKSAILASTNRYIFVVQTHANRIEVRNAIKLMYGITPIRVNIQNIAGKRVRFGRRSGKRSDWKKAIVTLPKGKTINIHEGV